MGRLPTATNGKAANERDALPSTSDYERGILGAAARDWACAQKLAAIPPHHFVDPVHRAIASEAVRQWGIDQEIIIPRLAASLVGKLPDDVDPRLYLVELATADNLPTATAFDSFVAELTKAARKRQLYGITDAACESALNGKAPDEIYTQLTTDLEDYRREAEAEKPREKFTFADLRREYPRLNPPVVDGLFRAGETCNLISVSKVGKSWLAYNLALSIITGQRWLGRFETSAGKILLLDNELHRSTLAHRIPTVADAMGIVPGEYENDLQVWPLRGNLRSLADLESDFDEIEPGAYQVIILDAKYRFAIQGVSENENASETALYNRLDQIAERTKAALVLIHHSTKGSQSDKRITDVGAGAGAQSRAADCHLILREHEQPDVCVLDAAVRSFPPIQPVALRWCFPLWLPADDVDTGKLKGRQTRTEERQSVRDREGVNKIVDAVRKWNPNDGPATARQLRGKTGLSRERQQRLLDLMESDGHVTAQKINIRGNDTNAYQLT